MGAVSSALVLESELPPARDWNEGGGRSRIGVRLGEGGREGYTCTSSGVTSANRNLRVDGVEVREMGGGLFAREAEVSRIPR